MSNINGGQVLRSNGTDFRLVFHPETNQVVGWNRQYFDAADPEADPYATNTWTATNFGTPQEAAQVWGWIPDELGKGYR